MGHVTTGLNTDKTDKGLLINVCKQETQLSLTDRASAAHTK